MIKACHIFLNARKFGVRSQSDIEVKATKSDSGDKNKSTSTHSEHGSSVDASPLRRFITHASVFNGKGSTPNNTNDTPSCHDITIDNEIKDNSAIHFQDSSRTELSFLIQNQCLRIINNAIADHTKNRYELLEQKDFLEKILNDLDINFGNTDIINKELSILNNLVDDFVPGAKFLAYSDLAIKGLIQQLNMVAVNSDLKSILLPYIIVEILDQENGSDKFPTDILSVLLKNAFLKIIGKSPPDNTFSFTDENYVANFKEEGKEAALLLMRFVESDTRFEEFFASDRAHLVQYIVLGLSIGTAMEDDVDFPDMARRLLASMGNISSHTSFQKTVSISLTDPIFSLFVRHLKEAPSVARLAILFQGISCVVLGNLVTSKERVDMLLEEFPNAPELAMKYLSSQTDPYVLQGAHFIKNLTVSNPKICAEVADNGGIALILKLLDNKLFIHLRTMGIQITKNIFNAQASSRSVRLDYVYSLAPALIKTYKTEDKQAVRNQIVLAADAIIEYSREFYKPDTINMLDLSLSQSEKGTSIANGDLDSILLKISKILIHSLRTMYIGLVNQDKYVVDPLIAMKASKGLGLLSTFPTISKATSSRDPIQSKETQTLSVPSSSFGSDKQDFLLQHVISKEIENGDLARSELIDLMSQFSTDLVECENQPISSHHTIVSSRHKSTVHPRQGSIADIAASQQLLKNGNSSNPSQPVYKFDAKNNSQTDIEAYDGKEHSKIVSYKPVVNNLGFLGSQIRKWSNADTDLEEAANIAIRNATR